MKNLMTILFFSLLIVSCKKEESKPDVIINQNGIVYQDSNVKIDSCTAIVVNGKYQVSIKGEFLNPDATECSWTVVYNQIIITNADLGASYFHPYSSNNYAISGSVLTSDTLYKSTLRVWFLPNDTYASTHNGSGIGLNVTFK